MSRPLVLALGLALAASAPAPAQSANPPPTAPGVPADRSVWRRGVVHYGKWLAAAGAIGLTALAVREHEHSAREWDQLLALCRAHNTDCTTGPDDRYTTYAPEFHYEKAIYYDHRARRRLIGGQLSLLTAAALFLADLRPDKGPENIPFHGLEVTPDLGGRATRVGVRIPF
jgi:hypothetical protein